jgi:outer membrane murein-binding lipoprotein Lpp
LRGTKKGSFKQPLLSYVFDCFLLNEAKLMIKKVAVIALVIVASLLVAGCTSPTKSNQAASSTSQTASSSATTKTTTTTEAAASAPATPYASASIISPTNTPTSTPTNQIKLTLNAPSTVKRGSSTLSGTFSDLSNNFFLYVLTEGARTDTWEVYAPLLKADGTYTVNVNFETPGSNVVYAIITTSYLKLGTITTFPNALEKSGATVYVERS